MSKPTEQSAQANGTKLIERPTGPGVDATNSELNFIRSELDMANRIIARMQEQLTATQMHEQTVATKFRDKIEALQSEVLLAQKGLTSGCGCPIGKCIRRNGDTGSCWLQWAEGHLLKRMGSQRVDEVMRRGHHPGRFHQVARVDSPPSIAPPAPGEDDES